ncbi:MAG: tetratricopeptide repeat protein [Desulfovibrionaceae bacterium]
MNHTPQAPLHRPTGATSASAPVFRLAHPARLAAIAALAACVLALAACGPAQHAAPAHTWEFSPQGEAAYYYLLFQDARQAANATAVDTAVEKLLPLADTPDIFHETAKYYWQQGDAARTREILKQGLTIFPDHLGLTILLAQTYLAEKRIGDAAVTLQAYITKYPNAMEARLQLASMYLQHERYAEALDTIKAIPKKERGAEALYYMARAYSGLGLRKQAVEALRASLDKDSRSLEAWAELAYMYEQDKDFAAAETAYSRILELSGDDSGEVDQDIWVRLIDLNLKLNNPDRAVALVAQGPKETSFYLQAGTSFLDNGFYDQARTIFTSLINRQSPNKEVYFYLALVAYEGDKNPAASLKLLEKIPDTSSYFDRALRFRSHLLHELGRDDEALVMAQLGQKRYPDESDFSILEAEILEARGDLAKAQAILETAVAKWPDETSLLYQLGINLDKQSKQEESLAVMEKIIGLDPEHADALNYVGYTLADLNRDLKRALVLVQTATRLKPDNGYILDSLAWVYFRMGKLDDAWREINLAVETGRDPIIWEHFGDIAAARKDVPNARKGYRKALDMGVRDADAVKQKLKAL